MSLKPDITLYSLEGSRAIRIAWLLEELNLPYTLVTSARAPNYFAPQSFKDKIPTFLGKSPTIVDNGVVIQESGAIIEYICENYDPTHKLMPSERAPRAKVRELVAAAEATLLIHAMPILYAMWRIPDAQAAARDEYIDKCAEHVVKDLDWLEQELAMNQTSSGGGGGAGGGGLFFVGETLTAADVMMVVSLGLVFQRDLGTKGLRGTGRWARLEKWVQEMQVQEGFKRAADKTNYYMK